MTQSTGDISCHDDERRSEEKLVIAYRSVSVGLSKGLPLGVGRSKKSDPSADVDNVISVAGRRHFSWAGAVVECRSHACPTRGVRVGVGVGVGDWAIG